MDEAPTLRQEAGEAPEAAQAAPLPMPLRVGVGLGAAAAVVALLALDTIWPRGWVYASAGALVVAAATAEFVRLGAKAGLAARAAPVVAGAVALFLAQWAGWAFPAGPLDPWASAVAVLAAAAALTLTARVLAGRIEGATEALALTAGALLYVPLLMGFLTGVRLRWGVAGLFSVLLICKGGAAGAYFFGKGLGRLRLAPAVSPNKTLEGAVGQIVVSLAAACALSRTPWALMGAGPALAFGAVVGLAAMLGDLAASLLKRRAGAKDSGRLLPGSGGMLDLMDDVLFAAPAGYAALLLLAAPVG